MKIDVLCSDKNHPIIPYLNNWRNETSRCGHQITIAHFKEELIGGDVLFLVSCTEVIRQCIKNLYQVSLVLHASDLPVGRGWSPHIWALLAGETELTVSLLDAAEPVDSGAIWLKSTIAIEKHEIFDEINHKLFNAELSLMTQFLNCYRSIIPQKQTGVATYYRRRDPEDSQLNMNETLLESFDRLRVADPNRYPAYFYHLGFKYKINIEKLKND